MEPQFWIKAWTEGRTNFHREHYHEKLAEYFPLLNPQEGQKVLVPLCGKTKDLLWLRALDLDVHGVELHDQAVKAFFTENGLSSPKIVPGPDFTDYVSGGITVSCGDFFALGKTGAYDLIYDRAALVALPAPMRKKYADVTARALKKGGRCLLIAYEYDPSEMEGPPFSVDDGEIHALYRDLCTIRLMESKKPDHEGARLSSVKSLVQKVYILEKRL